MLSALTPYILPAIGAAFIVGWLISGFRKRYQSRASLRARGGNSERYHHVDKQGRSFFALFWLGSGSTGVGGGGYADHQSSGGDGGGGE